MRAGNLIHSDGDGRGLFHSYGVLPGGRDAAEYGVERAATAHVSFLPRGRGARFCFQATIKTAAMVCAAELERQANDAVAARMSAEEQEASRLRVFVGSKADRGGLRLRFSPPVGVPGLGGLTPEGAKAAWLRERWAQRLALAPVGESAAVEPVKNAICSVVLIVAAPNLTVDAVVHAIEGFRARGETAFVDAPLGADVLLPALDPLLQWRLLRWDAKQAELEGRAPQAPEDPEVKAAARSLQPVMRCPERWRRIRP